MKRFVIGDIHGNFNALRGVLQKSGLDYEKDKLIILGDVVDGGSKVYECVKELLKIKNRVFILGNHDRWFINWYSKDWEEPPIWTKQGGDATIESYLAHQIREKVKKTHRDFFNNHVLYHIEGNMLFVHGGLGDSDSPQFCDEETLLWDRKMIYRAKMKKIGLWDKIFVGHTTTEIFGKIQPIKFNNVIMLDTGAGWRGKLTIMNIDTEEYWQGVSES